MGLTLQFVTGNKKSIIEATRSLNFDFFDQLESESKLADFSLHLIPEDLNLLVAAATKLRSIPNFGLRDNLDTELDYFDSEDCGAYPVSAKIANLFATFEEDALLLTESWFHRMNKFHNENLSITDEAVAAIKKMILICKNAKLTNTDVVHVWFL